MISEVFQHYIILRLRLFSSLRLCISALHAFLAPYAPLRRGVDFFLLNALSVKKSPSSEESALSWSHRRTPARAAVASCTD